MVGGEAPSRRRRWESCQRGPRFTTNSTSKAKLQPLPGLPTCSAHGSPSWGSSFPPPQLPQFHQPSLLAPAGQVPTSLSVSDSKPTSSSRLALCLTAHPKIHSRQKSNPVLSNKGHTPPPPCKMHRPSPLAATPTPPAPPPSPPSLHPVGSGMPSSLSLPHSGQAKPSPPPRSLWCH